MDWFLVFVFFYTGDVTPTAHWWGSPFSTFEECVTGMEQRADKLMKFFELKVLVGSCQRSSSPYEAKQRVKKRYLGSTLSGP